MKKVWILVLSLMLAVSGISAMAEPVPSREGTVIVEGMEEQVTEFQYESLNGFTFWYPIEYFMVVCENDYDVVYPADAEIEGVSMTIVPVEVPVEEADALLDEAMGGYMEGEAEIGDIQEMQISETVNAKTVDVICEDVVYRFYLITGNEKVFCLMATFPLEALEGFGTRLDSVVSTFEIL